MATMDPSSLNTVRGVIVALQELDPDNLVQIQNADTDEPGRIVSIAPDPLDAGKVVITYALEGPNSP